MSPLEINLDNVEPWKGGDILPAGTYTARAIDVEEGRSPNNHYQLVITWEAVAGDLTGGQLRDWVVITENSMGKVKSLLACCGVTIPAGPFSLSPDMIKGRTCVIVARDVPKPDGQPQTKVVAYQAPTGAAPAAQTNAQPSAAPAEEPAPF
jgi:hypothetical protein